MQNKVYYLQNPGKTTTKMKELINVSLCGFTTSLKDSDRQSDSCERMSAVNMKMRDTTD